MHPMSGVSQSISSSSRFATWSGTRAARCDSTIMITSLSWPGVMCVEPRGEAAKFCSTSGGTHGEAFCSSVRTYSDALCSHGFSDRTYGDALCSCGFSDRTYGSALCS